MKYILLLYTFIFSQQVLFSQQFYTDKGVTKFDGSKAAFEPIKASNNNTVSIIDSSDGQIAAVILISEFDSIVDVTDVLDIDFNPEEYKNSRIETGKQILTIRNDRKKSSKKTN